MKTIRHPHGVVYLLGTVQGLTNERKRVAKAFARIRPKLVALPLSKEALHGLKSVVDGETDKTFLSNYEQLYAQRLAEYGEVQVPPPALVEAYERAVAAGVKMAPIDMSEDRYADAFTDNVSTFNLIRHGQRFRRLKRKRFDALTAREFVFQWDETINKLKGFRNLEHARELYMAERLRMLAKRRANILAIIQLERVEGVAEELREMLHTEA